MLVFKGFAGLRVLAYSFQRFRVQASRVNDSAFRI